MAEFHTSSFRFADDIDLRGKNKAELQELTTSLEQVARRYGMEISRKKSEILINSTNHVTSTNVKMNWQTVEEVKDLKYFGYM